MLRGQFRQSFFGAEPAAFVSTPTGGFFVTESVYQASGYQPHFEDLPSQEDYESAAVEPPIEACKDPEIAKAPFGSGVNQFETLALAMARFPDQSDAWRDFTADCQEKLAIATQGDPANAVVPDKVWAYWTSVAEGENADYDHTGKRTE
jgi:hypothetical protein